MILSVIKLNDMWSTIPNINTVITLIAFTLAVILSVVMAWLKSKQRKIPIPFWIVVVVLVLIGFAATVFRPANIYRVRVTVLSPEHVPIENAKVWSSLGGEPKRVA